MSHRNAPLAPAGRLILIRRVTAGRPVAHVAKEMGISRPTAYRWVNRYRDQGLPGLEDRSSRPKSWQNGKAERFNRTLQEGWAYRQVFTSNQARTDALQPWLDFYNHQRPHGSLGGKAPITRCNQPAV